MLEILLINNYHDLELGELFVSSFEFWAKIIIFLIKNTKIIVAIELEKYIAGNGIFGIIISKFCYKKKLYLIILFKVDKSSKVNFYCASLPLNLSIYW